MSTAPEKVREVAERVAESLSLEVFDIELKGSGKSRILRIYLDKPEGVTHEDCANFSREVSTIFDVEDAVPGGAYVLEVSSPGLDRRLRNAADFKRFEGSMIKVSTFEPLNNNRHFEGRMTKFEGDKITLDLGATQSRKKQKAQGEGELVIDFKNIEKANLVPEI